MPSALIVSVIEVQQDAIIPSVVNVGLQRGESYICCNLLPVHYSRLIRDLLPTRP